MAGALAPEPAGEPLSTVTVQKAEEDGKAASAAAPKGAYNVDEHLLPVAEVAQRYNVHVDFGNLAASHGLTSKQVLELKALHGPNRITPPKELPEIIKFLKQFLNPLMMLLVIAGGLVFMAYGIQKPRDRNNAILGAALLITVTLTCIMSYLQERSASNLMASLSKMLPSKTKVFRDGHETLVDAVDLVPGDLVRLYIGDRVPADIRIIETADLKTEQSSLTGESDLINASVERKHDDVMEAKNVVFMSSLVMNGEGRGIVVRTGDQTFIGKIASLAGQTTNQHSTLQVEVHRLVIFVAALAFTTGIILFVVGLARKQFDPLDAFVNGFILVIVANVPEGLPATVTSLLTLTAQRLKERNVLIKRTDIIENLGCASIIASDKTGTLTQNKMTVEHLWVDLGVHKARAFAPLVPATSAIARNSLNRRSKMIQQLARSSKAAAGSALDRLSRVTKPLAKPSRGLDTVSTMAIGRQSRFIGDGKIEAVTSPVTSPLTSPTDASSGKKGGHGSFSAGPPPPLSLQDFSGSGLAWDKLSALSRLLAVATICNKARFEAPEQPDAATTAALEKQAAAGGPLDEEQGASAVAVPMFGGPSAPRKVLGDATDTGLLRYGDEMLGSDVVRKKFLKVHEIPFNSANKWSLAITECPGSFGSQLVMLKGAPEIVVTKCSHYLNDGKEKPIDESFRSGMLAAYERCGFMGERVLGFCYKVIDREDPQVFRDDESRVPTSGLVFLGLVSLVDPPREGVLEAVQKCRAAGVRVAMVTGDHPLTAEAIARKVGLVTLQTPREIAAEDGVPESSIELSDPRVGAVIVTGMRLKELTRDEQWDEVLDHEEVVFARTSPQQKLQIVEHLQRRGEVVAVTGDGVNDSPALKRAQIGVAMGKGGSDVARDAADIVLLDDEFPSIVVAIEEGRVIYDNLKKTIAYTLTHALPELFPIFLNLALSFPLGLGGLMILSIDLVTEQGPAISLAYEHAEANVMDRPPRDVKADRLISGPLIRYSYLIAGVVESWLCMMGFFSIFWWYGISVPQLLFSIDKDNGAHFTNNNSKCTDLVPSMSNGNHGSPTCIVNSDGSESCWYSCDEQWYIYTQATSSWYVTLVLCQFWHIWLCKTRQVSIFKHGLHKNPVTFFGVAVSITVIMIILYVPQLHSIFYSASLIGIGWVAQLGFPLVMLPLTEYWKYCSRNKPESFLARHVAW